MASELAKTLKHEAELLRALLKERNEQVEGLPEFLRTMNAKGELCCQHCRSEHNGICARPRPGRCTVDAVEISDAIFEAAAKWALTKGTGN